jgi:predicted exporter
MRGAALVWFALVLAAAVHVALSGLPVATDLMALLPREDRDEAVQRAKDAATGALSQRVVVLVGHAERERAHAAAAALEAGLARVMRPSGDVPDKDALRRLGALYFPHRAGLLAEADREALLAGESEALVMRALSQVYGFGGIADARLLARDPFLLFPAFLTGLPIPASRLGLDEGRPTVTEDGVTWVLVTGRLTGEATSLAFQQRFAAAYAAAAPPGVKLLRLGTVFYAHAGAERAMAESSLIATVSLAGTALLLVLCFRGLRPLLLGVAAIVVGLVVALSACLVLFGELHVAAQLFGASLIGIAADYALLYFSQVFSPRTDPRARLAHVLPGITLGMLTTLVGYLTLAASPFPGLRQVAVFSVVGLLGSFATVVLWFPLLDRTGPAELGRVPRRLAEGLWRFWSRRPARLAALAVFVAVAAAGAARLSIDDDVRRQQALDPVLAAEQAEFQRLTGFGQTTQFFVVQGANGEQVLRREEALGERLAASGAVTGWQSAARFAPSAQRQRESRVLVTERLAGPHLAAYRARLGMPEPETPAAVPPLTPAEVAASGAVPLLSTLLLEDGLHLVLLDRLSDMAGVRAAADGLEGVRFVDPTGDLTELLGSYRRRAVALLGVSALLMLPLLWWRYGLARALRVMAPPAAAVVLAPCLLALFGQPFGFFSAMALVLALSIGVDYAVFFAEDCERRDPVVLVGVLLATVTTLLSFGLLGLSDTAAVKSFGLTMLAAIPLAFLLAPLAGSGGGQTGVSVPNVNNPQDE